MKVTVDKATPSPSGLRLGLRIEHEKAGWIRFATTVVLYDQLDGESVQAITRWLNQQADRSREDLDVPLDLDWA